MIESEAKKFEIIINLLLLSINTERQDMIQRTSDQKVGYRILTSISSVITQWTQRSSFTRHKVPHGECPAYLVTSRFAELKISLKI